MLNVANPTICVADDDRSCRQAVQEALETVGYATVPASTGLEALQVIRRGAIHVGVFDFNMPEMTGLDALRQLRVEAIAVPVIVMTSDGSAEVRERLLGEGAVSLLLKPIDLQIIRSTVRLVFEKYV